MNEYADTAEGVVSEIQGEIKQASGWYIALGVVLGVTLDARQLASA